MALSISQLLATARTGLDRLDPQAAFDEMANGAILIDTRCADARRETGAVPGSLHIPLSVLYWRLDPSNPSDPRLADTSQRFIVMCAHGYSSSLAAATLRDLGYERATDMVGGFEGWSIAGLPVEPVV